jgi:hypothetical protein
VCASAFENYLTAEVMRAVESPPSQRPHVMPLVVSVKLPDARPNWCRVEVGMALMKFHANANATGLLFANPL